MSYSGTKAQTGRGSLLSIGGTPTPIGEVNDVPFAQPEWDFVDVTNFDSGSDQELIPTIRKVQTFTVKGNRVSTDAGQIACTTAYGAATLTAFTLTLPKSGTQTTTGDKYAFNAYVKAMNFDATPTKQIEFSLTLQTSGAVTFTAGT